MPDVFIVLTSLGSDPDDIDSVWSSEELASARVTRLYEDGDDYIQARLNLRVQRRQLDPEDK